MTEDSPPSKSPSLHRKRLTLPTPVAAGLSKTKATSLRKLVRSARKSMERKGTDNNLQNKPSESSAHDSTLGEGIHEVGAGSLRRLNCHPSIGTRKNLTKLKSLPFLPREVTTSYHFGNNENQDDDQDDHDHDDDEVSLGSVGAAIPLGKHLAAMDSSWGTLQTSGDSATFPNLSNSANSSPAGSSFPQVSVSGNLGTQLQQLSRQDSARSLASWGDLSVGNENLDLQQSASGLMPIQLSQGSSARLNTELSNQTSFCTRN